MTRRTFQILERISKWTTITFAWCGWIAAYRTRSNLLLSILIVVVSFVPYLLIYNSIVRGPLQRHVEESEEAHQDDSGASRKESKRS